PVLAIAFAPDGKRLVTDSRARPGGGASGREARVFDLTRAMVATPILVTPQIQDEAFSAQRTPQFADGGRVLVICPSDDLLRGIDVATGKTRFEHRPRLGSQAFTVSPDGQTVWVGQGENGRGVDVINAADGSLRPFTLPHTNAIRSIECTPDGRTVVTGSI